jgi:hypothetical protein
MLKHLLFIYDNNDFIDIGESMQDGRRGCK